VLAQLVADLKATSALEAASVVLGLVYLLLAVKRQRWCWVAGGLSSAIVLYLSLGAQLPMQAALNGYYVAMSFYGWWRWTQDQAGTAPSVSLLPLRFHIAACLGIVAVSALTAQWLASETNAAWPYLDSFTTWGSLFTTWLVARSKLENWVYWLVIDSILAFLFAMQGLVLLALLFVVYLGIVIAGFFSWHRIYRTQALAR